MDTRTTVWSLAIVGALALVGCGSSDSTTTDDGAGGSAGSAGGGGSAGATADAGSDAGSGEAITGLPTEQWQWIDFPDAKCRDGSSTGIGINLNPASTNVMIFLEGGGACFDVFSCGQNPHKFGASDFPGFAAGEGKAGIFKRTDDASAVKDWSFVYVPYCTGDVFAGDKTGVAVSGVAGTQTFVGYTNMGLFLERIVPTFASATHVLLTGHSAGGFGAAANYVRTQRAFGEIPVDLVDDSGPPMSKQYVPTCLQQKWGETWGLDQTIFADCGADCQQTDGDALVDYAKYIGKTYPTRHLGLVESTADNVISLFFGFGANGCNVVIPTPVPAATFKAGLLDLRSQLAPYPNFGTFYFDSTAHTSIVAAYDNRTAGGVHLVDWVSQLLSGTVTNEGPP